MSGEDDRHEAARSYLAGRKRLAKLIPFDLAHRFFLPTLDAQRILHRERLRRGEIAMADLTPSERRELVDPEDLDLHEIAAGPIMDPSNIYLPAGRIGLAEAKRRETAPF